MASHIWKRAVTALGKRRGPSRQRAPDNGGGSHTLIHDGPRPTRLSARQSAIQGHSEALGHLGKTFVGAVNFIGPIGHL